MMALICPAATKIGKASTAVVPCVSRTATPPSVVGRGNADTWTAAAGPICRPKMLNIDPRAIDPFGSPAGR
jgi:hypothetical protein